MAKVTMKFEGEQGSGKTILSRTVRDYLGNLGFKVEYIADKLDYRENAAYDTLRITTTRKLLERASKKLPK